MASPSSPSSKARYQIRQVPGPAPLRSNGPLLSGMPRIIPWSSVMTKVALLPEVAPLITTSSGSPMSSTQITASVLPSARAISPADGSLRITMMPLERSKQPMRLSMLPPRVNPATSPKLVRYQMTQVPGPAPSRSKGPLLPGIPRISPEVASVITKVRVSPVATPSMNTASGSPMPSTQMLVSVLPSSRAMLPASALYRTTVIGLDRSKQPTRSLAFSPMASPSSPSSKARYQIRQVPGPAPLRSNGPLLSGMPRIRPWSSVMMKVALLPEVAPLMMTSSGSPMSSTQITASVLPSARAISPADGSLRITVIPLERSKQPIRLSAFSPTANPSRPSS